MATVLAPDALLPLTCTRAGTCCHGKAVWVTPWEVARLAEALGTGPERLVRDRTDGGIRLRFDGADRWRGQPACTLYDPASGCRAHGGRPLACRLYPLGRRHDGTNAVILHEGTVFPCLDGCPSVVDLPRMTVADYLRDQGTGPWETAQDRTRELATDLAEAAFAVVVDSGLLRARGRAVVKGWAAVGRESPAARATALGPWFAPLVLPRLGADPADPAAWVAAHHQDLQHRLQDAFARLADPAALAEAGLACLRMAVHLGQACGGDAEVLARTWARRAESLAG
jgi:Fe-S-cluster containining protein